MKIRDLLNDAARKLSFSDTSQLDAQVLFAHVINKPRTWVMAHLEDDVTEEEQDQIDHALKQLEAGQPLPYVLGKWEFFGLEFSNSLFVSLLHLTHPHPHLSQQAVPTHPAWRAGQ